MPLRIDPSTNLTQGVDYRPSPDHGGAITPEAIVIHFTGAGKAAGSVDWLTRADDVYVSAHVVIDRDGSITQLIPFNFRAFHAGRSAWEGRASLNNWSIGIELANHGLCAEQPDGRIFSAMKSEIPRANCVHAAHKHGGPATWWERFPDAQVEACAELCAALKATYPVRLVLGHDDVAPGRKVDPGPAFDMAALRTRLGCVSGI